MAEGPAAAASGSIERETIHSFSVAGAVAPVSPPGKTGSTPSWCTVATRTRTSPSTMGRDAPSAARAAAREAAAAAEEDGVNRPEPVRASGIRAAEVAREGDTPGLPSTIAGRGQGNGSATRADRGEAVCGGGGSPLRCAALRRGGPPRACTQSL